MFSKGINKCFIFSYLITSCDIFHVTDMEVYARAHHISVIHFVYTCMTPLELRTRIAARSNKNSAGKKIQIF